MDEDLPVITESQFNAKFGGAPQPAGEDEEDLPVIRESTYNAKFGGQRGPASPTLGESARFIGKHMAQGAGDIAGLVADYNPFTYPLYSGLPQEAKPSSEIKNFITNVFGSPEDEQITGTAANVAGAAARGALIPGGQIANAVVGGTAELGSEVMPDNPVLGSLLGLTTGLGITSGAKSLASGMQKAGKAFERSSVSATAKNFVKSQKDKGLIFDDEAEEVATKLSTSIERIGENEGFGFLRDPGRLAVRNKAVLATDGKKIGDTIALADEAGVVAKLDLSSPNSATQKLIENSHAEKADIKNIVREVKQKLFDPENGWDGTLSGLNKWKTSFGQTGFSATAQGTTKPAIERKALQAVYKDIDEAVRKGVTEAGATTSDEWSSLLQRYSDHKELAPVLNHAAASELGSTYDKVARGMLRTSGGVLTTPTLIGAATGGAFGGPVGLAIGAGLGAVSSPTGSGIAGNVLKVLGKTGKAAASGSKAAQGLTGLLNSVTGVTPTEAVPVEPLKPDLRNFDTAPLQPNLKEDSTMARSPAFNQKVNEIAQNLDTNPEHLFKAMAFETGGTFDPKVTNKAGSGATGLIQFMGKTAKDLTGADSKDAALKILSDMSATEQLDYVEKYLKPFKGKLNSLEDVYMAILYPKAVGKDSDYTLFKEGTKAYWQNRGLDIDGDGVITKAEATSKVKSYRV